MFLGVEELALCVAAFINLGIGLYVFLTNPRDPTRRAFVIFVGGISLWVGGFFLLGVTLSFDFHVVTQFEGLTGILGLFLFAELFPRSPELPLRPWVLYVPFVIGVLGIVPWRFIVVGIRPLLGNNFLPGVVPLSTVWMILICGYVFVSLWLVVVHYTISRSKKRTHELQKSQESQRHMLLDIAHGLQTPLAIFQTKLERLKLLDSREIDIETFEQSIMNVSNFIENLLKLAHLENGNGDIHFQRCSLSALAEEIVEEVEIISASRGIRVTHLVKPGIEVLADEKKLHSAVMNLASNSIKYMRSGCTGEIYLELDARDANARFLIRDNGIGIDPACLPRIFERFYRAANGNGVSGGGLGLAISKSIVECHGGILAVRSELGKGTEVIILLPLVNVPAVGA